MTEQALTIKLNLSLAVYGINQNLHDTQKKIPGNTQNKFECKENPLVK